jgi:DUF1365 family protein
VSLYVDDRFYRMSMHEASSNSKRVFTYATKIQSIRVDWIINEKEGYEFLKELNRQKNKNIYVTPFVQIVIEYLYKQYR